MAETPTQTPAATPETPTQTPASVAPNQQATTPPAQPTVSPEVASLTKLVEGLNKKLSDMEAAIKPKDPAKPEPTEAEKVLTQRFEADIATLKPEFATAIKEIAGDNALLGMRVYTALHKAGMFTAPAAATPKPAAPTDKQNLDGTAPNGGAPKNWAEATSRIATSIANPRL